MSDYLTTLVLLRERRIASGLNTRQIEQITAAANIADITSPVLTVERMKQLENLPRHEPTYAEARTLARLLLAPSITSLMTTGTIYSMTTIFGVPEPTDLTHFTTSSAVPLSIACRLAISLGFDDPLELDHLPIHTQLWDTLSQNERGAGQGECPWCLGVRGDHSPLCLPAAIWSPLNTAPFTTSTFPRPAKPRTRGDSHLAHGLKLLRTAKCITQGKLAADVGLHPNYISRIECLESKLTQGNAEKIAQKLGVPVETLFERPVALNGALGDAP